MNQFGAIAGQIEELLELLLVTVVLVATGFGVYFFVLRS
jgi:hypothetical protein